MCIVYKSVDEETCFIKSPKDPTLGVMETGENQK